MKPIALSVLLCVLTLGLCPTPAAGQTDVPPLEPPPVVPPPPEPTTQPATEPATEPASQPVEDPELREIKSEIRLYYMILEDGKTPQGGKTWLKRGDKLLPHLSALLASNAPGARQEALLILRDHLEAPEAAPHVAKCLEETLAQAQEKEGPSRMLACQVLGKYGDLRSVPVLLLALNDAYMRVGKPAGAGEKERDVAVWWEADEALRKITAAAPIKAPARNVVEHIFEQEKEGVSQQDVASAWKAWWSWRPGGGNRMLSRAQAVELASGRRKDKPGRCVSATYEKTGEETGVWTITWRQWKQTGGGEVAKIDPTEQPATAPSPTTRPTQPG